MDITALAHTSGEVLKFIADLVKLLVLASIITSWIGDQSNQIVYTIKQISEPIYKPFRKIASKLPGPLDWAPILVFICLIVIEGLVIKPLLTY